MAPACRASHNTLAIWRSLLNLTFFSYPLHLTAARITWLFDPETPCSHENGDLLIAPFFCEVRPRVACEKLLPALSSRWRAVLRFQ